MSVYRLTITRVSPDPTRPPLLSRVIQSDALTPVHFLRSVNNVARTYGLAVLSETIQVLPHGVEAQLFGVAGVGRVLIEDAPGGAS